MIGQVLSVSGDKNFVWNQSIALATWTVPHNLNKRVSVVVVDSANNVITTDIFYVDLNIIQIIHGSPLTGAVFCN